MAREQDWVKPPEGDFVDPGGQAAQGLLSPA
jgi:hypothetical protein